MMELTVLGSGNNFPQLMRAEPAYLLKSGKEQMLIDCSADARLQMVRAGFSPHRITRIMLTHLHPDHVAGLLPLIWILDSPKYRIKHTLRIYGPKGTKNYIKILVKKLIPIPVVFKFRVHELTKSDFKIGNWSVKTLPLAHPAGNAIGYRLSNKGKTLVYTGDTAMCANLKKLSKDADALLIDASTFTPNNAWHIDALGIGKIASEARVKTVIPIHMLETYKNIARLRGDIRKNFKGKIIIAKDLMRVRI